MVAVRSGRTAMVQSLAFGVIASSALVIGAIAGLKLRIPERVLAAMLAFAAGALMTALAFVNRPRFSDWRVLPAAAAVRV